MNRALQEKLIEPMPRLIAVGFGALGILLAGCVTTSPSAAPAAVPIAVNPILISPRANATMPNGRYDRTIAIVWGFDWSDVPNATEYHLRVTNPRATFPLIDREGITASAYHHVSEGSYIAPANVAGWTWSVRARVNGRWQAWSEPGVFNVAPHG